MYLLSFRVLLVASMAQSMFRLIGPKPGASPSYEGRVTAAFHHESAHLLWSRPLLVQGRVPALHKR
jgi:hypothetical protein